MKSLLSMWALNIVKVITGPSKYRGILVVIMKLARNSWNCVKHNKTDSKWSFCSKPYRTLSLSRHLLWKKIQKVFPLDKCMQATSFVCKRLLLHRNLWKSYHHKLSNNSSVKANSIAIGLQRSDRCCAAEVQLWLLLYCFFLMLWQINLSALTVK